MKSCGRRGCNQHFCDKPFRHSNLFMPTPRRLNKANLTVSVFVCPGEAHCTDELDSTVGSGIRWVDTLAGYHDEQPCPTGITGMCLLIPVFHILKLPPDKLKYRTVFEKQTPSSTISYWEHPAMFLTSSLFLT